MTRLVATVSRLLVAGAATVLVSAAGAADSGDAPAPVTSQIFEYKVTHAVYGDIGTYTNVVEQAGDAAAVHSTLDLTVRLLGLPLYRETGQRLERWRGERLVEFQSVTDKNGTRMEVTGRAHGDVFLITGPWGTTEAPKDIRPSNPWSAKMLQTDTVMSTSTGRVYPARVSGGGEGTVTVNGQPRKLRQFEVMTDKQEFLWLDERDVPVAFGTEDNGSRVEFTLTRMSHGRVGTAFRLDKLPAATTAANDP